MVVLNSGSSLVWRANLPTPFNLSLTRLDLSFTSFNLNLASARFEISNHGLETTVYRPLGPPNPRKCDIRTISPGFHVEFHDTLGREKCHGSMSYRQDFTRNVAPCTAVTAQEHASRLAEKCRVAQHAP